MPAFKCCQRRASRAHMQILSAYPCFRCSCGRLGHVFTRHSSCPPCAMWPPAFPGLAVPAPGMALCLLITRAQKVQSSTHSHLARLGEVSLYEGHIEARVLMCMKNMRRQGLRAHRWLGPQMA